MTDKPVIELECDDFVPHVELRGYRSSSPMSMIAWHTVITSMLEKRKEKPLSWQMVGDELMVEVETSGLMKKALNV